MAGFQDKVDKAKKQIADAKKSSTAAAKAKELTNITDKAKAEAKVKRDYAGTLQGTLDTINSQLDIYATKIARGDKLTSTEQKELDRLLKQSQDVSSTIDKALKDAVNIEAQGQRDYAAEGAKQRGVTEDKKLEQQYGYFTGTDDKGNKVTAVQTADKSVWVNQNPYTGKLTFGDVTQTYKNGKMVESVNNKTGEKSTFDTKAKAAETPPAEVKKTPVKTPTQKQSPTPTPAPTPTPTPEPAPTQATDLQTLLKKTEFWYNLPDYIFQSVPDLGKILVQAVNEGWSNEKFLAAAQLTPWWQSNSAAFRTKIVDKAKYDELRAQGLDVSKTDYGQAISGLIRNVKAQAKSLAGVALDDAQAQQVAEKIYNGNLENDPLAINRLIIPFIGKTTDRYAGMDVSTYGGQALKDYQMLQGIAKANGLNLKDVLPQISAVTAGGDLEKAVLQGIAAGDIDINRVAQNARMVAAQGQPQYVRDLLNQGYDLAQIYAPYKNVMANVLEVNPDQIDLNDPTLRSAINNNGDMNVYDFKKALRKDSRWQYTEGARQEVSDSALKVLRDFGFQG